MIRIRLLFILFAVSLSAAQTATSQALHTCGMQLNTSAVIFCDTFDTAYPDSVSRTGDLDENVWGVSRAMGGGHLGNLWAPSDIEGCNGLITNVLPPNDILICNGQLRNSANDQGDVMVLAMYPKQPFDWAGRTGTVSWDMSNDTQGPHAAWPEFWITDTPLPTPFNHFDSYISLPRHGFGIRFAADGEIGQPGLCPNLNNLGVRRWTVDSAVVIRDYVYYDTENFGTGPAFSVTQTDCVIASGANGPLSHVEVRVNSKDIEVWASDPGSTSLRKIAQINDINLSFTRGLIWLEDARYNSSKGACEVIPGLTCQTEHTFTWDNVAFDGPFTYRDFSFDALDNNVPGPEGKVYLGKEAQANQTTTWNVQNMPANPQAAVVRVLFNFFSPINSASKPTELHVTVNGHFHNVPWPYPADDAQQPGHGGFATWRSIPVTIPITDLVAGTNVVLLGGDQPMIIANVNIVLVDVPGGVPVLPGSNNAYPGTGTPSPMPRPPSGLHLPSGLQ